MVGLEEAVANVIHERPCYRLRVIGQRLYGIYARCMRMFPHSTATLEHASSSKIKGLA